MTTTMNFKDRMKQMKATKAGGGGYRWFKPGRYVVSIDSIKVDTSDKPSKKGKEYFAVGATIVETDSADPDMQVGKSVDWSTGEDKPSYNGNVKQFLCGLWGVAEPAFDGMDDATQEEQYKATVGAEQAFTGRLMTADVTIVTTQKNTPFTAVRWGAVPEEKQTSLKLD